MLVSRQIWNYETGKLVNGRFISRGDKVTATPWLLDRFQNSALIWKKSKIHFGLIASGEKLVNSTEFREKLIREEPELIGGEMEGNGLVAIAERYKKDWILVKGISDWGANKSDGYQKVAAENSFEFVLKTIIDYF